MRSITRIALVTCLAASLSACPRPVRPPAPAPSVPPAPAPDLRGAAVYRVDPQSSVAHILVFRGGKLAKLGHNHVVSAQRLSGRVWIHPELARSGFELSFAVEELIVDDPEARRVAGSEFAANVPQADRDGTRKNMLRAEVLDAGHYPQVKLSAARVAGTLQAPRVAARITIKDASREVEFPVRLTVESGRLHASGELDIQQTGFGIKPFSVALGAIEVQDRLHVDFKIAAEREE